MTAICYNNSASTRYLQVFNTHTIPPDGTTVRIPPLSIAADGTEAFDFGESGLELGNGLYLCGSTTAGTKTLVTANDVIIHATFKTI